MVGQELVKLEFWFGSSLVSQAQDRLDPQRPEHHQPEGHLSPPHHCSPRLLTGPTLGLCIQLWVKSSTASTSFHSNLYSARDRLSLTSTAAVKAQEIAPIGKKLSSAVHVKLLRCVWLFGTTWTITLEAALSVGFSRQEYWSGLPWPSPGDLPDPEMELMSLVSPALHH